MNKVLDTGLIQISDDEISFDVTRPRDLQTVVSIALRLFASTMTWLNTSSLPVTVLSCRYVEECLNNYDGSSLESCNFGTPMPNLDSPQDSVLVHKVLLSYIRGLLIFIRNVTLLGQAGVLYEEEDLTSTSMGFNLLLEIDSTLVQEDIRNSVSWLQLNVEDGLKDDMISFLNLVHDLSQIQNLLYYQVDVYRGVTPSGLDFLHNCVTELTKIKANIPRYESLPDLPAGCLSSGIQKRRDNFLPPRDHHCDPVPQCIDAALHMCEDLVSMMGVTACRSITELNDFYDAFMNKRNPSIHVIARGLFQLFFIKDDRTVMGDQTKKFTSLLIDDMNSLTCHDSKIFQYFHKGSSPEFNQSLLSLLNNLESAYYSYVLCVSQNRCRQRQHFNKAIMVWDTLQVQTENFELEIGSKYNVTDVFTAGDSNEETPVMAISSWVYYQKLRAMLEVLLRGVELEVYRTWELFLIYWYIEYLCASIIGHFARILSTMEFRRVKITNMSKKIKKIKAGEKKQQLKELYNYKLETDIPQLDKISALLNSKEFQMIVFRDLAIQYKTLLSVIYDLKLLKLPKMNKIPERLAYELQMKPFRSVGVPEFADFDRWAQSRELFVSRVRSSARKLAVLEQVKSICNDIKSKLVSKAPTSGQSKFVSVEDEKHNLELIKSCVAMSLTAALLAKKCQETNFTTDCALERYRVEIIRDGYHRSFPMIKISSKVCE